jgi:hypothetical protein
VTLIVIKPDPDDDEYVLWSTITQRPEFSGTTEEILDKVAEVAAARERERFRDWLRMADGLGSSGRIGRWDDEFLPTGGRNGIPRAKVLRYYERLVASDQRAVKAMQQDIMEGEE